MALEIGGICGGSVIPADGEGGIPYAAYTINYAGCQIDKIIRKADDLKNAALAAIKDLNDHAEEGMIAIGNVGNYNAKTDGVPQEYAPYTGRLPYEPDFSDTVPDAPEMPNADEPLITPCDIDAIFNRAKAKITKTNRKATDEAMYVSGRMGIGMSSPTLRMSREKADYENNGRTVEAALESAVQEGQWKREDKKDILNLQATIYQAGANGSASYLNAETARFQARLEQVKTHIQKEGERRGWSELQMKVILEKADKVVFYSLEKTKVLIASLEQADQATAQLLATMAQGLYAAADVGVSGSGNYSGSESQSTSYSYSGEIATP